MQVECLTRMLSQVVDRDVRLSNRQDAGTKYLTVLLDLLSHRIARLLWRLDCVLTGILCLVLLLKGMHGEVFDTDAVVGG